MQLRARVPHYWLRTTVLLVVGAVAGDRLASLDLWDNLRYRLYQWQEHGGPRNVYIRNTTVVMIGDAEYWGEELAGRVPIRRDYLARLVEALDSLDAAVIAIDFDLRSPYPDGRVIDEPAYKPETDRLLSAVDNAALRRPVILPKAIGLGDQGYTLESDVFDRYRFRSKRVLSGYIALPGDFRNVPLALQLHPLGVVDSFAEAIVRAYNVKALSALPARAGRQPLGSYLPSAAFPVVAATAVLAENNTEVADQVAHKIVLVGGNWHVLAFGKGPMCDAYTTPAGDLPGVMVHANYVEALLDGRIYWPMERIGRFLEWALLLGLVVGVTVTDGAAWRTVIVAACCALALGVSIVSLRNFGRFLNFGFPVALLLAHHTAERVLAWRRAYKEGGYGD